MLPTQIQTCRLDFSTTTDTRTTLTALSDCCSSVPFHWHSTTRQFSHFRLFLIHASSLTYYQIILTWTPASIRLHYARMTHSKFLICLKSNSVSLANRTHDRQRRTLTGIRQLSGRQHGRELCPRTSQERLRHILDNAWRRGWWQDHQRWHRTGRRRTQKQNAQERLAGDRPVHHLWQPNRLNATGTTSKCPGNTARFRDQTRVMEHA